MAKKQDVSGIPDVDLGPVMDQLKAEQQNQAAPQSQTDSPTAPLPTEDLDLGQFKNPKDMLKSYKEIQAAFTRTTQENKDIQAENARLKEERELAQMAPPPPQQTTAQQQDFETAWMEDPQKAIDSRVSAQVAEQVNMARITDVVNEEQIKEPEAFMEREAYAKTLAQDPKYAHLGQTPAGVRKLFQIADKLRVESLKTSGRKSLEHLLGEPVTDQHIENLKKIVGTQNNQTNQNKSDAYMPDTSTSTQTGTDQNAGPDLSAQVEAAVDKGDVDGVLDVMFKDIMAK